MEHKHTPWTPYNAHGGRIYKRWRVQDADRNVVCELRDGNNMANAYLIAAAPDLLAACETAENELRRFTSLGDAEDRARSRGVVGQLHAAIRKARGEA